MKKMLIVINKNDEIIEQKEITKNIDQRKLIKETRKKYKNEKINIKIGYIDVSEKLFNETKSLLEEIFEKYPELGNMYVKDRSEFKHLGYEIKKER